MLVTGASAAAARGLSSYSSQVPEHRLSGCGAWAQLLRSMCNLPASGIAYVSLVLAGRLFTPEPPEALTVLSIHSSLMTNDVENLFMPSFAIHISSLMKYLFLCLPNFYLGYLIIFYFIEA